MEQRSPTATFIAVMSASISEPSLSGSTAKKSARWRRRRAWSCASSRMREWSASTRPAFFPSMPPTSSRISSSVSCRRARTRHSRAGRAGAAGLDGPGPEEASLDGDCRAVSDDDASRRAFSSSKSSNSPTAATSPAVRALTDERFFEYLDTTDRKPISKPPERNGDRFVDNRPVGRGSHYGRALRARVERGLIHRNTPRRGRRRSHVTPLCYTLDLHDLRLHAHGASAEGGPSRRTGRHAPGAREGRRRTAGDGEQKEWTTLPPNTPKFRTTRRGGISEFLSSFT